MACGRSEEEQQSAWCQWVMQGSSVEWFHSVAPQGGGRFPVGPDRCPVFGWMEKYGVRFGSWKMLKDVERWWKMLKDVERCWKMLKDVERCWKMLKDDTRPGQRWRNEVERSTMLFSWVNRDSSTINRLGHGFNSKVLLCQRVSHGSPDISRNKELVWLSHRFESQSCIQTSIRSLYGGVFFSMYFFFNVFFFPSIFSMVLSYHSRLEGLNTLLASPTFFFRGASVPKSNHHKKSWPTSVVFFQ